ncbi:hypothetical protein F2P56_018072 [Juglans regia]|uniref:BHLH domain-containing protein n=2 Tax=Juglans regia TaxID=51240 RepID=A0A833TL43_JUGRE|nr:transcription factor bHLH93-like [Juglans regia]KAF5462031.1 hypothetical protein F2P56_018072 [Juglans regia]
MELNEQCFLEELLALRGDTSKIIPAQMNEVFSNGCSTFDYFNPAISFPEYSCCEGFSPQLEQNLDTSYMTFNQVYCPFGNELSAPQLTDSSLNTLPFPAQEDYDPFAIMEEKELGILGNEIHNLELQASCKAEPIQSPEAQVFTTGECLQGKNRAKKLQGHPSKNLMAERRRRKRLNDRLSMLRSIVPKISRMDRTSILGDTIDYMKELLGKINHLQLETEANPNSTEISKNVRPNEVLVRNSPKFDVERRNVDTRIDICCAGKPGLLLLTLSNLEALGLEIEECVISCFNDFTMQASCSDQDMDQRAQQSSEDIKQALFRNSGFGGCL